MRTDLSFYAVDQFVMKVAMSTAPSIDAQSIFYTLIKTIKLLFPAYFSQMYVLQFFYFDIFKRFRTMQLILSLGFLNASTFLFTLLLFIGYPLTLVSSTNLQVTCFSYNCTLPHLSDLLTVCASVCQLRSYFDRALCHPLSICPYSIPWAKEFHIFRHYYLELFCSTGPIF